MLAPKARFPQDYAFEDCTFHPNATFDIMEILILLLVIAVVFSFIGGLFDGASMAAGGCGKVIGAIIVVGAIIVFLLGGC